MEIGLFSFADVNNYGDKYFSLLCQTQLTKSLPQADFTFFTPTGAVTDGIIYHHYNPPGINGKFDALLLIGGEVIHTDDQLFQNIYRNQGLVSKVASPTDMVFRLPELSARYKAWFSLGITSSKASPDITERLQKTLPLLNKIALRGLLAKDNLDALLGYNLETEIVPDLGWLIPQINPDHAKIWGELAVSLKLEPTEPYFVFHTLPWAISQQSTTAEIADKLGRVAKQTGLKPLLLPITRYAGDAELLQEIAKFNPSVLTVLPTDLNMYQTAAVLLNCQFSVTSSMHGAVTCLANGIPAGIVHIGEAKLTDVFGHQMRLKYLRRDWQDLEKLMLDLWQEPRPPLLAYANLMRQQLEIAFAQLAEDIKQAQQGVVAFPFKQLGIPPNKFSGRSLEWWSLNNTIQQLESQLAEKELELTLLKTTPIEPNEPVLPDPITLISGKSLLASNLSKLVQRASNRLLLKAPILTTIYTTLDLPVHKIKINGKVEIIGWAFSTAGTIESVKAYLDGHYIGNAKYGLERLDVAKAHPIRATPYCGYQGVFNFDLDLITPGQKILSVEVTDSVGHVNTQSCIVLVEEGQETPQIFTTGSRIPLLPGSVTKFKIFVTDNGNHFMQDIALIFQEGLSDIGFEAELAINAIPETWANPGEVQLIVAPHEFYPLFLENELSKTEITELNNASFLLNVEQPGSQWFEMVCSYAKYSRGVWDINRVGVESFAQRSIEASHLPLGYVPFLEAYPPLKKTIDILFMGTGSLAREEWLAEHGDFLTKYKCHLFLVRLEQLKKPDAPGYFTGQERARQLSQSKILLNIHMAKRPYFEWHRALLAIANRCLLITETAEGFEPLINGEHFIMVEPSNIEEVCRYYLENEEVRLSITRNAYAFMRANLEARTLCSGTLSRYHELLTTPIETSTGFRNREEIHEK